VQIPPAYAPTATAHVVDLLADRDERLVLGALVVSPDGPRTGSRRYFFITVHNRVNAWSIALVDENILVGRVEMDVPGESWSTKLHGIELGSRPVWFA
jgi:hypothetical protein